MCIIHSASSYFPNPATAKSDGLLAIGGNLAPERVFLAHCCGIFPWFNEGSEVLWWSPDPRAVIATNNVHISRSLRKYQRGLRNYYLTLDNDFEGVIRACANAHGDTWITNEMITCYCELHQQGRAHSCELWLNDRLVGGLYGVALKNVFCGESMFGYIDNGSKIVLVALTNYLNSIGIGYVDTQFLTPHLVSMGAYNLKRKQYLSLLDNNPDKYRGSWAQML